MELLPDANMPSETVNIQRQNILRPFKVIEGLDLKTIEQTGQRIHQAREAIRQNFGIGKRLIVDRAVFMPLGLCKSETTRTGGVSIVLAAAFVTNKIVRMLLEKEMRKPHKKSVDRFFPRKQQIFALLTHQYFTGYEWITYKDIEQELKMPSSILVSQTVSRIRTDQIPYLGIDLEKGRNRSRIVIPDINSQ